MKIIRGQRGKSHLYDLCNLALHYSDEVWAAVAYVSDDKTLIKGCYERDIPLKLWARYDYSVPVKTEILKWFIGKSPQYVCKLIPDIFHPKVIWWRPYGVYLGSANLTVSAWYQNYEAGVFLKDEELEQQGLKYELEQMFDDIDDASHPLTEEIIREIEKIPSGDKKQENYFEAHRSLKKLISISAVHQRKERVNEKQNEFLIEWNRTLQYIRDIGDQIAADAKRPKWIPSDTPKGMQADQFLHAYYYNQVMENRRARYNEFHRINSSNPTDALKKAILWWSRLESPPSNELYNINSGHEIRKLLRPEEIGTISEDKFVQAMSRVHAFRDYSRRASYKSLGLSYKLPEMKENQRSEYLSRMVYNSKNANNETIIQILNYIMYEGSIDKVPDRICEIILNPGRKIPFIGVSTLGEVVGWAMPENYPPRNGRTSKALYSLGYKVKIHTE